MKTITKSALAAAVLGALMLSAAPTTVMAAGGASGAAVKYDHYLIMVMDFSEPSL